MGASLESAYRSLRQRAGRDAWLLELQARAEHALQNHVHGDLPRWRAALQNLPDSERKLAGAGPAPRLGGTVTDADGLREALMSFHPWRKGPLELGGVLIDAEWRSDWKWDRVQPHIDLGGERVLDIGCGNGYFGWRMLADGASLVVGIDPTLVFVMQWLACRHFAGDQPNYVLPLGIEDLPPGPADFHCVFSMGVLYHRRDPVEHLRLVHSLLRPGGTLVLESLVLTDGRFGPVLVPESRYARMRNVWAVPSAERLLHWVSLAGFTSADLLDVSVTSVEEQRSTEWMRFESLPEALDPQDAGRTLEGYPAPARALIIARH